MKNHTNTTGGVKLSRGQRAAIFIASLITAIAVAVACVLGFGYNENPVSVDEVDVGEVSTSTTYSNKTGNLTTPGTLKKGDILNYTTSGSILSVTLPTGTYRFDIYGAEGGGRRLSGNSSSGLGGYGGYSYGTYKITAASQTIYMAIGGYGRSSTSGNAAGGYNGGGQGYASSSGEPGNGGGGATHVALRSGLLSSLSSYKTDIIMVAGGGGGGGEDTSDWYGHGGGSSGVNGTSSNAAGHGTQTKAGTGGGFGYGGGTNKGDGGGGGGGWYGGGTTSSTSVGSDTQGGGGGSGYVNTSKLTGYSTAKSTHTGNGSVKITVKEVNTPPVSLEKTFSSTASNYYRGSSRNIAIAASAVASDRDYANISGGKATNVYFTNGTSSNYDTIPASNAGLYLDQACSKSASTYLNWTWTASQLTITDIKRLPRNGVDGATADRRLTLFAKVRDAYGTTTTRGVAVVRFYFTVNDNAITPKASTSTTTFNKTGYSYRYGNSTADATDKLNYLAPENATKIYNPNGAGKKTVFLPKPISPTDKTAYTIYASDIYSDADTAYDKVAFKSLASTSSTAYYSVTYNADSSYATGLYPSITIKATGVRPPSATYVATTITAQTSESASSSGAKVGIGTQNTEVQLVFRIANTRPYFASSNVSGVNTGLNSEPYVEIAPGKSVDFSINKLVYDVDDGNSLTATFAQGTTNLIVPAREYVQVDASNLAVPLKQTVQDSAGKSRSSNYFGKATIASDSSTTAMGTEATGFNSGVIAITGSAAAATACVTYSYANSTTIRFTARAATTYMYGTDGRLGDFYVLVRVIDPSDTADAGLWYPIAIKVGSSAPVATTPTANFSLGFNYTAGTQDSWNVDGTNITRNDANSIVLSPISYTLNGKLCVPGSTSQDTVISSEIIKPFVVDPDTFVSGSGNDITINDIAFLESGADAIITQNTETFFKVERTTINIPSSLFDEHTKKILRASSLIDTSNDILYSVDGLTITPIRATDDEYFEFKVNVVDIHGTRSTVPVLIKVENRAVSPRRLPIQSAGGSGNTQPDRYLNPGEKGKYIVNNNIGAKAVNYTIERNDVIQITPYDFVYDCDVNDKNTAGDTVAVNPSTSAYNSNPVNAGFGTLVNTAILRPFNVYHTSDPSTAATQSEVTAQKLSFTNVENFKSNAAQYSNYVSVDVRDYSTVGETKYNIPSITVQGVSRTTTAVVQLRFTVSDGYSSMEFLITVTVLNAKPVLNTAANHPTTGDTDKRIVMPYSMAVTATDNYPTSYQFTAAQLAFDKDGDSPTFVPSTVKVVALLDKTKDPETFTGADFENYFAEYLSSDFKRADAGAAAYRLSDYVSATLSKNSMGEDVLIIRALSSTQLFPLPIYVIFDVQDGYRAQIATNTLCVLIDVVNTAPITNTDGLTQTVVAETNEVNYNWMIKYQNAAEKSQLRYIVNSKELYDSNAIVASAENKIYLFDDVDAKQNVMLAPAVWNDSTDSANSQPIAKVVEGSSINENSFDSYNTAAIIYSATYKADKDSQKQFLNVSVKYFKKVDGSFVELTAGDDYAKCQYWAIVISDSGSVEAAYAARFAIAVKDDHHDADVYTADKSQSSKGDSKLKFINFYYEYERPNITAMHEYYRTDPNIESSTLVDSTNQGEKVDTDYMINVTGISSLTYYKKNSNATTPSQDELKTFEFADNFRYSYFAKTVTVTDSNNKITSEASYKHFPDTAFYYDPIYVSADTASQGTIVPMSYIAMPADGTTKTENGEHVTFANASTTNQNGKLWDGGNNYLNWGNDSNIDLVLDNLTLTDNKGGRWSGGGDGEDSISNNPYIDIDYACNAHYLDSEGYLNTVRFTLTATKDASGTVGAIQTPAINWKENDGTSIFREDKYGFNIKKKEKADRSSGLLTLTVALKTVSSASTTDSKIQYISVNIDVANSKPSVTYNNADFGGYSDDVAVNMTASDSTGKTVALINNSSSSTDKMLGDYRLYYSDKDKNDTMKFYMPSAIGGLSEEEDEHIQNVSLYNLRGVENAIYGYYDITASMQNSVYEYSYYDKNFELQTTGTRADAIKNSYVNDLGVPNPGYDKFFTVSPGEGVSSTLQFVPKAKTQLNIETAELQKETKKAELYKKYHLKVDSENKIYYPFRVIFYDEVDGSAFTVGNYATAIIRVYINNDPLTLNRSVFYDDKGNLNNYGSVNTDPNNAYKTVAAYSFSLSKNTNFFVDVTNLLVDNDIALDNGSFITSADKLNVKDTSSEDPDALDEEATVFNKYTHDYLTMPLDGGNVVFKQIKPAQSGTGETALPVLVKSAAQANASGLAVSDTTIMFNATSAFRDTVDLMFTFRDSALPASATAEQRIIFSITYNNENPTPNSYTFKGAETRTIEMTTGQSFKLYAADRDEFLRKTDSGTGDILNYGDVDGRFKWFNTVSSNYPIEATNAYSLDSNFAMNVQNGYLGALIVGSDDAASTLRFSALKFDNADDRDMFDQEGLLGGDKIASELGTAPLPMSYTFKAKGVTNAGVTLTLIDGGNKTVNVKFNIIVRSTAPAPVTDQATLDRTNAAILKYDAAASTASETVYVIGNGAAENDKFYVGQSATIQLRNFISDIDDGDAAGLTVNQNSDRSYFRIKNPNNVSAIAVETARVNADEAIKITATDLITEVNAYSEVSFAVADVHGEVSKTVVVRVYIASRNVESVAPTTPYAMTVMSYADYTENFEPVTVQTVSGDRNAAKLFFDADAAADSSAYDVYVYALLQWSTDRYITMKPADFAAETDKNAFMIAYRTASSGADTTERSTELAAHVKKFFTISVAQNGKTFTVIPNSATLPTSGSALDNIPLYITVAKRSYNGEGQPVTGAAVPSLMNVSVANSVVMATESTSFNMGYPQIKVKGVDENGEERESLVYRDEEFLKFTGTAGDSLTWDIYNAEDPEYGLFYDYDMLNVKNGANNGGTEKIVLSNIVDIIPERQETLSGLPPILTVDITNDKVTVKINRKTFTGQPPKDGYENDDRYKYSNVQVVLYAADAMNAGALTDKSRLTRTVINVRIENDVPEIKSVNDFAEGETRPSYSVKYSDVDGYVLDETLERGRSLRLNIADIVSDADIEMDEYVLVYSGGESSLMGNDGKLLNETSSGNGRIMRGSEALFNVRTTTANNKYNVSTLSAITFECVSATRGAVGTVQLRFRDSLQAAMTRVLTVNLTVDNIAPYAKPDTNATITVMGAGKDAGEEEINAKTLSFSILDYIADDNGDAYNAADAKAADPDRNKTYTYTYIDEIVIYNTDDGDPSLRPSIYGPNKDGVATEEGEEPEPATTVCYVDWALTDENHQTFSIIPTAGVYGKQKVALRISDSGYIDGSQQGVLDGKMFTLIVDIVVANPLEEVPDVLDAQTIAFGVTRTIDVKALLGEQNAQGYSIQNIVEDGTSNLEIYAPGESAGARTSATEAGSTEGWRIFAKTEGSTANVKVTFAAGNVTLERTLPIVVANNTAPDYKGGKTTYEYTVSKLDDQQNRTLKIYPEMWFEDADPEDVISFVDPVTSSQSSIVKAMYDYDDMANGGRAFILLTFNYRGAADITFNVTDLSGRLYSRTVTVICNDAPEMTWWVKFVSLIEANWMWFWIILGCSLLFIILLIVIIVVVHKKHKMRREIEALLESETELEEEMMRLNASAAQYQSFGYLPPTQQTMTDTGFMIGGGQSAPMQNSLQLNAGSGIMSQSAQINSVPGSNTATTVPGNRPAQSTPGNMNVRPNAARPNPTMPGNVPPRPAQPQQQQRPPQAPPPASNDGFNPDDF